MERPSVGVGGNNKRRRLALYVWHRIKAKNTSVTLIRVSARGPLTSEWKIAVPPASTPIQGAVHLTAAWQDGTMTDCGEHLFGKIGPRVISILTFKRRFRLM